MYGTRVAVLAGDYLFAQSSWFLANLENIEVGLFMHSHGARGGWAATKHCGWMTEGCMTAAMCRHAAVLVAW